ncbi:hypothetical protein ACNKHL_19420 [Shigella flexneri]
MKKSKHQSATASGTGDEDQSQQASFWRFTDNLDVLGQQVIQ